MLIGGFQKFSLIDYPEKLSAIIFTQGCNFRCPYCHNPELLMQTSDSLIEESFVFDFLKTRVGKLDAVVISGGEPCMQKKLVEFIKRIKDLGFLVKLDTNGSYPEKLEELINLKILDYIAMDIKAPIEKYNFIIKSNIDTDDILQSIEIIKDSGIDYEFRTTIVKSQLQISDFSKIAEIINGAKRYYLQKFTPTKTLNKEFLKETTYNEAEFQEIKEILKNSASECFIR